MEGRLRILASPVIAAMLACASPQAQRPLTLPSSIFVAAAASPVDPTTAADSSSVALDDEEYVLQAGDVLEVKFFYNPELNTTLPIRPDGRVSFELIGEVKAAGQTTAALTKELVQRYTPMLRSPQVAVIVKETVGQKVYIGGEVLHPGIIRSPGNLTALQAIVEAGGPKNTGEMGSVVVLRNQGTRNPLYLILNLDDLVNGQANTMLRPRDIVFVPRTRIARANEFVDQYIRQLLPITLSFGLSYLLNGGILR